MHELILFITGIIVGVMNAVAGGGMLVGFPVLVALGVPPLVANATGSLISAPGQLASAWGYRQYLRKIPRRFLLLVPPLVVGTAVGAITLRSTSADEFERIVPWLVFFGVCLFMVQPLLHFHLKQHLHGKHKTLSPLYWIALAMVPLGLYAGYFGAGFGFMMLAFLSFAKLSDIHIMTAMKNVGATCAATTSLVMLYSSGLIDWRIGAITGLGAAVGGLAGAHFSQKISSHWLRITVVVIGLSAVVYLALQSR